MADLAPGRCPFCRSYTSIETNLSDYEPRYFVFCGLCKARGPQERTPEAAVKRWDGLATRATPDLPPVVAEIVTERARQIEGKGFSPSRDDTYTKGELARAASCYALAAALPDDWGVQAKLVPQDWPWPSDWWKPTTPRRDLVKAGALIVAEGERLDRAEAKKLRPRHAVVWIDADGELRVEDYDPKKRHNGTGFKYLELDPSAAGELDQ